MEPHTNVEKSQARSSMLGKRAERGRKCYRRPLPHMDAKDTNGPGGEIFCAKSAFC